MATKTWTFTLDGQPHTLTLKHDVILGSRTIVLDGQLLEHIPRNFVDSGSIHVYQVEGRSLAVIIQEKFASVTYDLLVEGISLTTGTRGPEPVVYTLRRVAVLTAIVILLFGFRTSFSLKRDYDSRLAISEWLVVRGKVTSVTANQHESSSDSGSNTYYLPLLRVEYVVDDSRFTVQIEDHGQAYNTPAEALSIHLVGEDQMLYVNPANPHVVELFFEKLEPNSWIGPALIFMGLFTGLAILAFIGFWFSRLGKGRSKENDPS